jgi:hypothetical protein
MRRPKPDVVAVWWRAVVQPADGWLGWRLRLKVGTYYRSELLRTMHFLGLTNKFKAMLQI